MTGDEIIEQYAKHFMHGLRNSLLPDEYEWTCILLGMI